MREKGYLPVKILSNARTLTVLFYENTTPTAYGHV